MLVACLGLPGNARDVLSAKMEELASDAALYSVAAQPRSPLGTAAANAHRARDVLSAKMEELASDAPSIPWLRNREARWVQPRLTLTVRHLAGPGLLRHASVKDIHSG